MSQSATLNRPGVECHKNFVNFTGTNNLLGNNSMEGELKNCNANRGTDEEFPNYFPPTPIIRGAKVHTDRRALRSMNQRKSMADGDLSFYSGSEPVDDLIDLQPSNVRLGGGHNKPDFEGDQLPEYNSFNRTANQRFKNVGFYKMPVDFIPRSPNLGSQRRRMQNEFKNSNHHCDQIRGPAHLQRIQEQCSTSPVMVQQPSRTRSHTQLPSLVNSLNRAASGPADAILPGEAMQEEEDVVPRLHRDDWNMVVDGSSGGNLAIQHKMDILLRQKKSLRPRSYCSSNYNEFGMDSVVHAPN